VIIFKPYQSFWLALGLLLLPLQSWGAEFIPISEISRGMKGYGLTVFEGSRIDTFEVEVVGIQDRSRVDGSLILIEVSGHDLKRSNIAQGMSGSPDYIDGRFAGALAFGWAGALRPLAGVTPARDILGLPLNPELVQQPGRLSGSGANQNMLPLLNGAGSESGLAKEVLAGVANRYDANVADEGWPAPEDLILDLLR